MSWNYRVMERQVAGEESYIISEVYYNEDGTIRGCTPSPVVCAAESIEDMQWFVQQLEEALHKPVIYIDHKNKTIKERKG